MNNINLSSFNELLPFLIHHYQTQLLKNENLKNLQTQNLQKVKIKDNFYFFVENEFVYQNDCDLRRERYFTGYAMTINLIKLSKHEPVIYKIFSDYSNSGFNQNEMRTIYEKVNLYIKEKFENNLNNRFIGCVRDNNNNHSLCIESELNFECRTDPYHDIFNILKHIYLNKQTQVLENFEKCSNFKYENLKYFQDIIQKKLKNRIPKINSGFVSSAKKNSNKQKRRGCKQREIWMPKSDTASLEKFIVPINRLFKMNYFEKIEDILVNRINTVDQNLEKRKEKALLMIKFIILLKNILNFQNQYVNVQNMENYRQYFAQLSNYKFPNSQIKCLNSLQESMRTNISTFEELLENNIKFKPKFFSTQIIEGEKGHLRYHNCGDLPTKRQCEKWFEEAESGVNVKILSEFGRVSANFSPLPQGISTINRL